MADVNMHIVLFEEINPAAEALDVLRGSGVREEQITVLSAEPYSAEVLGRPEIRTNIPWIGISGFLGGVLISFLLVWGTPQLYPIQVGGRALFSIPPWLVLGFEFSMLGLLIGTFLGVIWESNFPDFSSKIYHDAVSDGEIGIIFKEPSGGLDELREQLTRLGGTLVEHVEEKTV